MSTLRTDNHWPLQVRLSQQSSQSGRWQSERWVVADLLPHQNDDPAYTAIKLQLHRDDRTSYRFNLNSRQPHLFLLCSEDESDGSLTPIHITASQEEAASFMDGEHQVLETPMPEAVQCWIDTYLGIHGELIDAGKKKKKGRGRSSGN
ncbi:DUF3305 domain-containing protein [Marinobacterium jannaschii]|uniref:DUF3305 domain-containing protein n=1 Tax=Marinobacterium jannaschii TaxID=64970 RepID=UPI000483FF98|nr:DUF3305 domain-containing protein [Marinobacterium jannaschii]